MNISKERLMATILGFVLLTLNSSNTLADPLRVWMMPNDHKHTTIPLQEGEIVSFISGLKKNEGIIIENDLHDLMLPAFSGGIDPLGNFLVRDSQSLDELVQFQRSTGKKRLISLEIIRWENAFTRLTNTAGKKQIDKLPDVVQIGNTWTAFLADQGALENLKGLIDEKTFFPSTIATAKMHGRDGLFAIPWFVELRLIFYKKDKIPNPDSIFSTTDNFEKNCTALLEKNPNFNTVMAFPMGSKWDVIHTLAPWLWGDGGDIIKPRSLGSIPIHKVKLDSKESLSGIDHLYTLSKLGCISFPNSNFEILQTQFLEGKFPSIVTGSWFLKRLDPGWDKTIGISLPPAGKQGSHPFIGGSNLAIWSSAKKRGNFETALDLIGFLTSPISQRRYSEKTSFIPARESEMENYFSKSYRKILQQALINGKNYPIVPEWMDIVENEPLNERTFQIWEQISQRKPLETIHQTTKNVAQIIRRKVFFLAIRSLSPYMAMVIVIMTGAIALFIFRNKCRYEKLLEKYSKTCLTLEKLSGQRRILLARLAAQNKSGKTTDLLKHKIEAIRQQEAELSSDMGQIPFSSGSVSINWDGTIILNGEAVGFENNRQAKALIEYVVRVSIQGQHSVHCLVGYPLFGWQLAKLKSTPNHLFKIAVSKINSELKRQNFSPILTRENRNSLKWKICWNKEQLMKCSSIGLAKSMIEKAVSGDIENISQEKLINILSSDPKNTDVYEFINTHPKRLDIIKKMETCLNILREESEKWKNGVCQAQGLLATDYYETDLLKEEIRLLKNWSEYIEEICVNTLKDHKGLGQDANLKRIIHLIEGVRDEISEVQKNEQDHITVWSIAIESDFFLELTSIPNINKIINTVYNQDTQSYEDPNLVQLSLLKACSNQDAVNKFKQIQEDNLFFKEIGRQIRIQLKALENEFGAMPEY